MAAGPPSQARSAILRGRRGAAAGRRGFQESPLRPWYSTEYSTNHVPSGGRGLTTDALFFSCVSVTSKTRLPHLPNTLRPISGRVFGHVLATAAPALEPTFGGSPGLGHDGGGFASVTRPAVHQGVVGPGPVVAYRSLSPRHHMEPACCVGFW